jgi:hypothetical protein
MDRAERAKKAKELQSIFQSMSKEGNKFLVQAGPDVLTQADGTYGAGTRITLLHKCPLEVVEDTHVTANPPACSKVAEG